MLIRHVFYYLCARGLPGLVNFAALAVYTRLLTADDFGRYALIVAVAGLVQVVVFQALSLVLGRFLPARQDNPHTVLQSVLALFLVLAASVVVVGTLVAMLSAAAPSVESDSSTTSALSAAPTVPSASTHIVGPAFIALILALAIAIAWHELNLRLATALLAPQNYGLQSGLKALLALLFGSALAWAGWGAKAPVVGLITGAVLSWLWFGRGAWQGVRPRWPDSDSLKEYSAYGLPLVSTFVLVWVVSSSDRIMLTWLVDEAATGLYSAGYDLAQHSLGLVLVVLNTAALPLVIRALEHNGLEAATVQMRQNGELIVAAAMAGAAGLLALGPAMIELFVGESFRAGAASVFPWISLGAAIAGIKSFHFDIAFHLSKSSGWLMRTSALAAVVNVGANLVLIPRFGIVGAAWASVLAFLMAALASAWLGRRVFPMPRLLPSLAKGAVGAVAVYVAAALCMRAVGGVPEAQMWLVLVSGLLGGSITAGLSALVMDIAGIRNVASGRTHQIRQRVHTKNR